MFGLPPSPARASALLRRSPPVHMSAVFARDIAAAFTPSDSGGDYWRRDPGTIIGKRWIRDLIADANAAEPVPVPAAGVATIRDAVVCGEGLVCKDTLDGPVVVRETLYNARFDRSIRPMRRDEDGAFTLARPLTLRRRLPGKHVLLRQIWDSNYGHWLVECLPRIALVAERHDLAELRFIVSHGPPAMRRIYEQTLGAFGIRPEQIVTLRRRSYEVEELIYPLPMTIHPWIKAPRVVSILEGLGAAVAAGARGPNRIYVSRAGVRQRHLLNEAQVLDALRPHGFTIVHPEAMSFSEQVRMFAGAEIVIGNAGAGLTNIVFAPRGVTLFALTSEAMGDDFFWDLTNLKGGRYVSLHGTAASKTPGLYSDFTIDMAVFRRQLDHLMRATPEVGADTSILTRLGLGLPSSLPHPEGA